MHRRDFLKLAAASVSFSLLPAPLLAAVNTGAGGYGRLLILVELKGGNDGLNTVIPYGDPAYYALRPKIAIPRDSVIPLSGSVGLHPAMEALLPIWKNQQLTVLQGVGYPDPNLSHFRSIEIWDTASSADEFLQEGWLARTFTEYPPPRGFTADGIVIGSAESGPLLGNTVRTIVLSNEDQFRKQARLVTPASMSGNAALQHIIKVENDILQASSHLGADIPLNTQFPSHGFGKACAVACQLAASPSPVAVIRITLNGFDTHQNQLATQAGLLRQLAEGLAALQQGLDEAGKWNSTLIMTYAEFGRRARENQSGGTDHGTANMHFAMGGRVKGGLLGSYPSLTDLDGAGNVRYSLDFRSVYASVMQQWWGLDSSAVLGRTFRPLEMVRA